MDTATKTKHRILEVSASSRRTGSVSRALAADIIAALESKHGPADVTRRDLADGVGFVDEAWIAANFTAAEERNAAQLDRLAESDTLVAELQQADTVVIGAPIYNFGVPASLKAWVDMIARARLTFRYTENGPEGLLQGKQAYVVVASGGVPVDSPVDFATPYLRQALGFVGITDVNVIAAEQLSQKLDDSLDAARARIAELINTTGAHEIRAA